jgi:hypothetical protein
MALDRFGRPIPVYQPPLTPPPSPMLISEAAPAPQPDLENEIALMKIQLENMENRLALLEAPPSDDAV